jgi:DNA-binding beta-propeller fold protein YncE
MRRRDRVDSREASVVNCTRRRIVHMPMLLGLLVSACQSAPEPIRVLHPDANPMQQTDPLWSPQPHRDRPRALCSTADGRKAWVMLGGTEDDPGTDVAVVDPVARVVRKRVHLAAAPWGCALDPSERYLVVTLRFADHAVVLDARTDAEIARVPVPYYTELPTFRPDGRRVYLTNRWKDALLWWDVDLAHGFTVLRRSDEGLLPEEPMGTPVPENPRSLAWSQDGLRLFVGSAAAGTIAVIDATTGALVDVDGNPNTHTLGAPAGITHLDFHSPVGGLAVAGDFLFIADTGQGTGSHPFLGRDLDDDGQPGDHTANVIFQDLGNELAVVDTRTLQPVHRYGADSTCCKDFRDVDPDLPNRGLLLPAPDTWLPDVVPYLMPKANWIVAGALPEAMVTTPGKLWVAYAGSNEVQGFAIGPDGSLAPLQAAGGLYRTGFNPVALARVGTRLVTVDRLAESLTFLDPDQPPGHVTHLAVGDLRAGPFPSTDAEIGEAINEMTAVFTIDGDQTCVHCHRDNAPIARPIVMPLQVDRLWGARNVMAQRGLYDTRPWFFESAMDETNFFPVLNEFTRKENFCCEGLDPTVWSKYPTVGVCAAAPDQPGCHHVLHCVEDPPPECAQRPYAKTGFLKRSEFIRDAATRLLGRDTLIGDVLAMEGPDGVRHPLPIDFDGMTRAIGLFMLRTPRLLPNPNRALDLPTARRGKALYESVGVGCSNCHPQPATTTATLPQPFSPFGMPVRFPPVVSPSRSPSGSDASQVTQGFIGSFPQTQQGPGGLNIGATPLRGLWDRPHTRLLHDGRARSLREVLATPGHAVLHPGEHGCNERDGTVDTHGGTSQLDKYQVEDLISFLHTL